jgi:hypothetical protein
MDFNATIDLIIKDLDEAREIIDDLKKYPGVPALQVELAKSKCKSAGEVISLLKSPGDNTIPIRKEPIKPPQQQQITDETKAPATPARVIAPLKEKQKETKPDETTKHVVIKKEESKKSPKNVPDSTIIADRFSHLSNRFNEQLGSLKSDDDILKSKPLTSLSEAIGVNDRFLFIREIFDGNKDAYTQAISRLDNSESLADAKAVIMSYTGDNNENEAVKQLIDLVKRKLPSNE